MKIREKAALGLLAAGLALGITSGCSSSAPRGPSWNEGEPVVRPLVSPDTENRGRIVVKTQRFLATSDDAAIRFRGYRIYDASGKLVHDCRAHFEIEDILWLEPGRYIALGTVHMDWLFTYREVRVQFAVEAHETTVVDLMHMNEP